MNKFVYGDFPMQVKINGEEFDLPNDSTIKDAIKIANAPYHDGCVLSVIQGKEEVESHVDKYKLKTNKGSIIIELLSNASPEIIKTWKNRYQDFNGLRIRWTTSDDVAIGPIKTDLEPSRNEYEYNRWDVILSLSGFTSEATHIIFIKDKHRGVYGVPEGNKGVFAKIIGGKRTIMKLTDEDVIKQVQPVVERKSIVKSASIIDLNTPISTKNEIYTYTSIEASDKSPESVEHFFALSEKGEMKIDYESNSFIGFYDLQGLENPREHVDQRKRGTVTVRNTGKGVGKVYIYREDRVSTPSHSVLGKVNKGMELLDIAKEGDMITFKTIPERIMALALTQKDAEELLLKHDITQVRDGVVSDDAIIIRQEPRFTMDIIREKHVKTVGINEEDLVYININNKAPRSSWYFKKITGLLNSPIGALKVQFAYPGTNVMMFEGSPKDSKGLVPENTPREKVTAGQIGLTNMSKKYTGMIGVRFEDNTEFGPTGEPFQSTNILGEVVKGIEKLEKFKEGNIVYVTTQKS